MPFGFWFLGITLPSFGGTLATRLLISGHLFAFCFIWNVTPGWWSTGSVWSWFGLSAQIYRSLQLIWKLLTLRYYTPPGNPLGEKTFFFFFNWSIYSCESNDKKKQPGVYQTKIPYFPRGTIPAGTNLPLLSGPIWILSGPNSVYKTITTEKYDFWQCGHNIL